MHFLTTVCTDVGIKKKTNQDAVLLQEADSDYGRIVFAAVCDGMGGLAQGEVASSMLIKALAAWFEERLPILLGQGFTSKLLFYEWDVLAKELNVKIANYGRNNHLMLGTTLTALLLFDERYYIVNIGDSRIYRLTDHIRCLTRDHSYVQQEMDRGRMTANEARKSSGRNVLLQCIGASAVVKPDYYRGELEAEQVFLLCSDGFRHVITNEEMYEYLNSQVVVSEENMEYQIKTLIDLNKYRKETDNISAILIKTYC